MPENEQTLVDRFCSGDSSAFQELVEHHKKKVYYVAYDITGNHHDAEDISQEVFIKMFRSLKTFRRDAKMSSWLYQIAVNTSIDSLRRKPPKRQKLMVSLDKASIKENPPGSGITVVDPEQSAEASILQSHISQALQKVSPRERSVFVMRHYNDLKMVEIAEILNVSVGTVKSLLFRAIKKLRKELSFYLGDSGLEVTYE
ncbi:MAG: RNA polymerase sigma factor [Candidatus Aminicenantes bacterium]|nr:RNA polymerase sigma factor [Candidatus Aminicenantes bacterium]